MVWGEVDCDVIICVTFVIGLSKHKSLFLSHTTSTFYKKKEVKEYLCKQNLKNPSNKCFSDGFPFYFYYANLYTYT